MIWLVERGEGWAGGMVAKNAGKALKNFEEKEHRFIRASSADPDVLVDTVAARVWGTRI